MISSQVRYDFVHRTLIYFGTNLGCQVAMTGFLRILPTGGVRAEITAHDIHVSRNNMLAYQQGVVRVALLHRPPKTVRTWVGSNSKGVDGRRIAQHRRDLPAGHRNS
jgi:hypothetical protein